MKGLKFLFLFLTCLLLLASCDAVLEQPSGPGRSPHQSRLLLYMHSVSSSPTELEFTIDEASIRGAGGQWVSVLKGPLRISSLALIDAQALVGEAFVPPDNYDALRLMVSDASVRHGASQASLTVEEADAGEAIPVEIKLGPRESMVVSIAWDPNDSIEKRVVFKPAFEVEPQRSSARDLVLFVSNSGSDYVSVLDSSLERVIAAVTVGDGPMGMALNSTKDTLYVVNSRSGTISVIDAVHFLERDVIDIPGGVRPTDVVFVPDSAGSIEGKLYVVNNLSNDVAVVSTQTRRLVKMVHVGTRPTHIAANAARKEVYVTNELSNSVSIISAVDDSLITDVRVNGPPVGIAAGAGGLYVFIERAKAITVLSAQAREVAGTIVVSEPPKRGLEAFDRRLFVANTSTDTVSFFTADNVVTRTIAAGSGPMGLAADESRNRLYVTNSGGNTVSIVDPLGERLVKGLYVGDSPYSIVQVER